MNRIPDERDMEQAVRSWMRDEEDHPADRNRQVGRIMGRVDEIHQRRGAWRFLPFGRGTKRIDGDDEDLYVAGGGAVAMRRGVSSAMAVAAVAVLVVIGVAFLALVPRATESGAGAQSPSPVPTVHPEDAALMAAFGDTWSGERTSLEQVKEVYAEDAVHTALWLDGVERIKGPFAILSRIQQSYNVNQTAWIPLPDAITGEHRYMNATEDLGGIACVIWIKDARVTRHDCILPNSSASEMPDWGAPAADTLETREAIFEDFTPGWGSRDRALIEATTSPEIVHHVAYDTRESTLTGIRQYMSVTEMGGGKPPGQLADPIPLPAPEGEHRWTDFTSVAGGSICTFWERDGLIARHDCIVPSP